MNWKDILERALWTGVQTPAAVYVLDALDSTGSIPDLTLLKAGIIGFVLYAVKSIAGDRLGVLRAKGRHSA